MCSDESWTIMKWETWSVVFVRRVTTCLLWPIMLTTAWKQLLRRENKGLSNDYSCAVSWGWEGCCYHGSAPAADHLYLTNIAVAAVPRKCDELTSRRYNYGLSTHWAILTYNISHFLFVSKLTTLSQPKYFSVSDRTAGMFWGITAINPLLKIHAQSFTSKFPEQHVSLCNTIV